MTPNAGKNPYLLPTPPPRLFDEFRVKKGLQMIAQVAGLEKILQTNANFGGAWQPELEWLRSIYGEKIVFGPDDPELHQFVFEEAAEWVFCSEKCRLANLSRLN